MFSFLMFILWILSLVMMFVAFHWIWLVAFIISSLYLLIRLGVGGSGGFDFPDIDFFD